jgi:hypothetical protein
MIRTLIELEDEDLLLENGRTLSRVLWIEPMPATPRLGDSIEGISIIIGDWSDYDSVINGFTNVLDWNGNPLVKEELWKIADLSFIVKSVQWRKDKEGYYVLLGCQANL